MADNIEELLRVDPHRWDRLISAELSHEIARIAGDKLVEIPELRRFLAVKGFRDLRAFLEHCAQGRRGEAGLRAVIVGMRTFAHERPGISAATFRSAFTDCAEWRQAGRELASLFLSLLSDMGLTDTQSEDALCTIRAMVRGFVMHEMQEAFLDKDCEATFAFATDALIAGLKYLAAASAK